MKTRDETLAMLAASALEMRRRGLVSVGQEPKQKPWKVSKDRNAIVLAVLDFAPTEIPKTHRRYPSNEDARLARLALMSRYNRNRKAKP